LRSPLCDVGEDGVFDLAQGRAGSLWRCYPIQKIGVSAVICRFYIIRFVFMFQRLEVLGKRAADSDFKACVFRLFRCFGGLEHIDAFLVPGTEVLERGLLRINNGDGACKKCGKCKWDKSAFHRKE
jgi:hypothetical protein